MLPPTFSMVHLLHRLYGVDAPGTCNLPIANPALYHTATSAPRQAEVEEEELHKTNRY